MDWAEMAGQWIAEESRLEASFAPVRAGLMTRAGLRPGQRVLDIGCGSGSTLLAALAAVAPDGRVTGVDIAPAMVARAARRVAGAGGARAELLVADAQSHDFEPGAFDAAISLFGMMFFDDTLQAFGNIARAMRPGARLSFAAWAARAENPWFRIPARVAQARLGRVEPTPPGAPGPFGFELAEPVLAALSAAGWRDGAVETVALELTPPGGPADVAAQQMRVGAAAAVMRERTASAEDRAEIEAGMAREFAAFQSGDGLRVPAQIHYYSARAPG